MARTKGPTAAGLRRRAQILREAEELAVLQGFDDLTMDAIAASSGVAKSTLYHYFPQKEDVLFALHEATTSDQLERLRAIAALDLAAPERLRLVLTDQLRLIAEQPGRVRVLMDSRRDKARPYGHEMAALERAYVDELAGMVQRGVDAGELRPMDPRLVADALLGITHHARYWFDAARHGSYQAVADELWEVVGSGLLPPPADA